MPIKRRLNNIILFNRQGIFFQDESETSPDIFRITSFPDRFTAGKNVIKIQGNANTLSPGAFIEIEVTDINGDPIYTEMLDYLEDDGSRAISIFIYPETPEGDCRLTLGTEIRQLNGQPIPIEFQGNINAIWSKIVPVCPTVDNESEVIFLNPPTATIEESIAVQLDREFEGGSQDATYTDGTVQYYEYNNDSKILLTGGKFVGDMKGGTITVSNPVNPRPVPNFTPTNPPSYTSTIKKVLNDQIISLDTPFTFLTNQSLDVQRYTEFDNSSYEINFTMSPEYIATQNSQSFALLQVKNLDPAAGAVSRIKMYANNSGTVGDFELINDIDLSPTEIFIDSTGSLTPDLSIGFFTSQSIIDTYWESQKWDNLQIETAPTLTWQTSSLNNAVNIEKTIESTNRGDIQILKVKDEYSGIFVKDSQYKVQFDAIATRLDSQDPDISVYMSGSAFTQDENFLNQSLGRNLGKRIGTLKTTSDNKRYDDQAFTFDADHDGDGVLIIVIKKGQWEFSEIQTTSDAYFGFSENYTRLRTLVPVAHKSDNQVSFKLEYYNILGEKSKTVTFINNLGFEGGNHYIDGDFSMLTGSLTVASSLRSGVEIVGLQNTGYVRSLGYEGFSQALDPTEIGAGGFLLFSGSALPQQSLTSYQGVGLEMVSNADNFFKFRTNPSILDIHTETFFLGNPTSQFISGAAGELEISSSGYHFRPNGEITASGGFLFGDKVNNEFIQFVNGQLVVRGDLSVDQIFTPALIGGQASNITNASSSITSDGFAKFVSASIGGWDISTSSIEGGNLVMKPEGILQTKEFATGLKGWKISSEANGTAEFENIRIRGTLRTTTFEKESVNAVGGQVWVSNSTTITGSNVLETDTTMSVKNASGFTVGEIILAKKVDGTGFNTEYLLLESASFDGDNSGEDEVFGRIYVQREYGSGEFEQNEFVGDLASSATTYTDGQVLVSTGLIGTGYIKLNANPKDTSTPYMDIVERTGSGLYDVELKARIGDLSGIDDPDFTDGVSGFGVYTENGYFKGKIELANTSDINIPGNTAYTHGPLTPHPPSAGTPSNDLLPNATWNQAVNSAIEYVTGPFGGQELVITNYPDNTWNGDGGFDSTPFPIDSGSAYMYIVYIKRTHSLSNPGTGTSGTPTDGRTFFGLRGIAPDGNGVLQDSHGVLTNNNAQTFSSNPYFFAGQPKSANEHLTGSLDRWFLHVGYVYPAGTSHDSTKKSVVYDLTTGLTGSYSNSSAIKSYIWKHGTTHAKTRAYLFYNENGDGNTKYQEIARPAVYKMDGTEPTIQSLLSNVSRGGNTVIDGSSITTGNIRSTNLNATTGSELALDTGIMKIGGTGAYTSTNGILLDGPNAQFAVGKADGQFVRFNHTQGALEISGSNFSLDAAGDVKAGNATFEGNALADIIRDRTVTIDSSNSGSYLKEFAASTNINSEAQAGYYQLVLDGSEGGEQVRRVKIDCDFPTKTVSISGLSGTHTYQLAIAEIKMPNVSNSAGMEILIEIGASNSSNVHFRSDVGSFQGIGALREMAGGGGI